MVYITVVFKPLCHAVQGYINTQPYSNNGIAKLRRIALICLPEIRPKTFDRLISSYSEPIIKTDGGGDPEKTSPLGLSTG